MSERVSTLTAGAHLVLAPGRVEITVRAVEGTLDGLRCAVVRAGGTEVDPRLIHSPQAGLLIFLAEIGACELVVVPSAQALPHARLSSVLTVARPDGSVDAVHAPLVDVSALPTATLLVIDVEPNGQWRVSAPVSGASGGERDGSPLRTAARAATRSIVGGGRAAADQQRAMLAVVDGSASMALVHDSGQLGALLDVVDGINDVVGADDTVQLLIAGDHGSPTVLPRADRLTQWFDHAVTGFTMTPPPAPGGRAQPGDVIVITDDVPPGGVGNGVVDEATVVVVGGSGDDHLGVDQSFSVVEFAARTGDQMNALVDDPQAMTDLVSALCPPRFVAARAARIR